MKKNPFHKQLKRKARITKKHATQQTLQKIKAKKLMKREATLQQHGIRLIRFAYSLQQHGIRLIRFAYSLQQHGIRLIRFAYSPIVSLLNQSNR
jgi:DNA primase catalytic subunit